MMMMMMKVISQERIARKTIKLKKKHQVVIAFYFNDF